MMFIKNLTDSHILNKSPPAWFLPNSFQKEELYKQKDIRSESAISCRDIVVSLHGQNVILGSF